MKKLTQIINDLKGSKSPAQINNPERDDTTAAEKAKLRKELRENELKGETEKRPSLDSGIEHR